MEATEKSTQEIAHAIFDISLSIETLQRTPVLITVDQKTRLRQYIETLQEIARPTPMGFE
jgi:hypothetical protein